MLQIDTREIAVANIFVVLGTKVVGLGCLVGGADERVM